MAVNISNFLNDELLDHVLRNSAYSAPATVYLALYTSDPAVDNSGTELTGKSGYARKAVTFAAVSSHTTKNSALITFGPAGESWGTISHVGILDDVTGGNLLFFGAASSSKTVGTGEGLNVAISGLTVGFKLA